MRPVEHLPSENVISWRVFMKGQVREHIERILMRGEGERGREINDKKEFGFRFRNTEKEEKEKQKKKIPML